MGSYHFLPRTLFLSLAAFPGLLFFSRLLAILLRPGRARGTVTDVTVKKGKKEKNTIYTFRYVFEVNGEAFAGDGQQSGPLSPGKRVTVYSPPKRPSDAEIFSKGQIASLFCFCVPLIGLLIALALLIPFR